MGTSDIVRGILGLTESGQQDMRFDCNARVEIWVTADDLEFRKDFEAIKKSNASFEEKKAAAMQVALQVAHEQLSASNLQITADISLANVNINRIDWVELLEPQPEEREDDQPPLPPGPRNGGEDFARGT